MMRWNHGDSNEPGKRMGAALPPIPDPCSLQRVRKRTSAALGTPQKGVQRTEWEHKPWMCPEGPGCRDFPPRKMLKGVDHCHGPKRDIAGLSALDGDGM